MTASPLQDAPPVVGAPDVPRQLENLVLLVDKPPAWSSFDVIRRLRRTLGVRKIGHAGTLDPMATGLLICLVGKATKQMEAFMGLPKEYEGVLRLGETTASYDAETPVEEVRPWEHVTAEALERARTALTGSLQQLPPMYSAVKVGGERLYRKARRGEEIERPARTVEIYSFELTGRQGPDCSFRVACSKGTYIRTLAHDFGALLGTGAHLVALRRTAIGPYRVERAWTVEALAEAVRGEASSGDASHDPRSAGS